jgi:branched-chain amino acid aminotransferase
MASIFYYEGCWYDESPAITGPLDHAFWLGSSVFDGARAFDGLAPDLDRHCARLVHSARELMLDPPLEAEEVTEICREAIRRLPLEGVYYVRPLFFPTGGLVIPDAASTKFVLAVHEIPWPAETGFSACLSPYRRPAPEMAPTAAKASCLYPNVARMMADAGRRGFDNAVVLDPRGDVAEFASANLWLVEDGVVRTPVANGTFLDGITRQRVRALLREDGFPVEESVVQFRQVLEADELFSTGNLGKVMACTRIEDRVLPRGPIFERARKLYFEFAQGASVF